MLPTTMHWFRISFYIYSSFGTIFHIAMNIFNLKKNYNANLTFLMQIRKRHAHHFLWYHNVASHQAWKGREAKWDSLMCSLHSSPTSRPQQSPEDRLNDLFILVPRWLPFKKVFVLRSSGPDILISGYNKPLRDTTFTI